MDKFYPGVLPNNENVHFKLLCRKFIEMVRREAESNMAGGSRRSKGHPQDMEIDDMDVEDGPVKNLEMASEALIFGQKLAAEYSNDPSEEVRRALHDIFSLMAYANPLKEKDVAHLLDRKGRAVVAEELNSAILRKLPRLSLSLGLEILTRNAESLGRSSRSGLENLYAQTSVLLDDIGQGGGPGAFITIQNTVLDQIPKPQF